MLPFTVLTSPLTSPLILILPFVTSTDLQSPWIFKVPKTGTSKFSTLPSILILIICWGLFKSISWPSIINYQF